MKFGPDYYESPVVGDPLMYHILVNDIADDSDDDRNRQQMTT